MEGKNPEVRFTVDWISATFTKEGGWSFLNAVWLDKHTNPIAVGAAKGYKEGYRFESGLTYSTHPDREDMGVHVVMSGSCLRWYWAQGVDWHRIMELIGVHGGRTSRVDLAIDVLNAGLTCDDLCEQKLRRYKGRGRTPKFTTVRGGDGSWTVYVGSRTSEKFLRIYDKAKEQGDYDGDYVRIELETKGECGHAVGWNFAKASVDDCVGMARALAKGVADFDLAAWDFALRGDVVGMAIPKSKERDTVGWLVKVCAPALAKQMALKPSQNVLDEFLDALRREMRERGLEA